MFTAVADYIAKGFSMQYKSPEARKTRLMWFDLGGWRKRELKNPWGNEESQALGEKKK